MLQPNDLPLLCLPIDLSDEAAAKFVEFLHELTATMERHYCAQLLRYYHPQHDIGQRDLDPAPTPIDPPFSSMRRLSRSTKFHRLSVKIKSAPHHQNDALLERR